MTEPDTRKKRVLDGLQNRRNGAGLWTAGGLFDTRTNLGWLSCRRRPVELAVDIQAGDGLCVNMRKVGFIKQPQILRLFFDTVTVGEIFPRRSHTAKIGETECMSRPGE